MSLSGTISYVMQPLVDFAHFATKFVIQGLEAAAQVIWTYMYSCLEGYLPEISSFFQASISAMGLTYVVSYITTAITNAAPVIENIYSILSDVINPFIDMAVFVDGLAFLLLLLPVCLLIRIALIAYHQFWGNS